MALRGTRAGAYHDMRKIVLPVAAFLIFSLLSFSTASAHVQVRLRVIQAANVGQNIDPSLKELHAELGSLFSFTSYRLLRDEHLALALNRPVSISAHPGRFMEVTLVAQRGDVAELRIRVVREGKDILNTQVRLFPGRTVLIGGPRHGEGVIIYAVSARL